MIRTLLIANRAEIACRVIRTARRMGIRTVAVFSDADANTLHVQQADTALHIGPSPARDSYLNISAIIAAARRAGADAIHPGYGFLSENPAFADACVEAGVTFVGPTAASMRAMGSKAAAKRLMEASRVPLLPGYHGDDQNADTLAAHAGRIGFPLVIKAVAGGGGRGMRVVTQSDEFTSALTAARQEGKSAFGDDRVLIERYLDRPRHIEVQIFGDTHGNVVHLFERDCSTQRRHQKIIEEAPAPGLTSAQRHAVGAAAVAAARAVDYVGAGTVEFVSDGTDFFFLEMNTRLQVEHPVTECITGFDLVEWQLRVAAGEQLPVSQEGIPCNGHALEARLYAEDPARDFAPSIGTLTTFRMPDGDVRVDAGMVAGDTISTHYDAMLGKIIVHAPTRAEAVLKLRAALADTDIAGVTTNLDLLARIAADANFGAGAVDTGYIARNAATLLAPQGDPDGTALALAALGVVALEQQEAASAAASGTDPHSPWHATDLWWPNTTRERILEFADGDQTFRVSLTPDGDNWRVSFGDGIQGARPPTIEDGLLRVVLNGQMHRAGFTRAGENLTLRHNSTTWRLRLPDPAAHVDDEGLSDGRLLAPLPGQVTEVLATEGQSVARGEVLVVLEAMKTVFRLTAPAAATIATITCHAGEMVQEGQVLIAFETA